MRRNRLELYLHLVWATWDWMPWITEGVVRPLYREIGNEACKQGCKVVALNGLIDHIHLLLWFPSTITVAQLVKQLKGVSSHFVNEVLKPTVPFKWQGSYGAFTVSGWDLDTVVEYVKQQQLRHVQNALMGDLEETCILDEL